MIEKRVTSSRYIFSLSSLSFSTLSVLVRRLTKANNSVLSVYVSHVLLSPPTGKQRATGVPRCAGGRTRTR